VHLFVSLDPHEKKKKKNFFFFFFSGRRGQFNALKDRGKGRRKGGRPPATESISTKKGEQVRGSVGAAWAKTRGPRTEKKKKSPVHEGKRPPPRRGGKKRRRCPNAREKKSKVVRRGEFVLFLGKEGKEKKCRPVLNSEMYQQTECPEKEKKGKEARHPNIGGESVNR